MAEQLNFFKEQKKKEKIDPSLEEPAEEETASEPTAEEEKWLLKQKEGEGSRLITEAERKKQTAEMEKALKRLKEKLASRQKKLKFE